MTLPLKPKKSPSGYRKRFVFGARTNERNRKLIQGKKLRKKQGGFGKVVGVLSYILYMIIVGWIIIVWLNYCIVGWIIIVWLNKSHLPMMVSVYPNLLVTGTWLLFFHSVGQKQESQVTNSCFSEGPEGKVYRQPENNVRNPGCQTSTIWGW